MNRVKYIEQRSMVYSAAGQDHADKCAKCEDITYLAETSNSGFMDLPMGKAESSAAAREEKRSLPPCSVLSKAQASHSSPGTNMWMSCGISSSA